MSTATTAEEPEPDSPPLEAPRIIPCKEQGPVDIPLSEVLDPSGRLALNPEIEDRDYFAIYLKRGVLRLHARGFVGFVPLNERIIVYIQPRVPISNLSRVVHISEEPITPLSSFRGYETGAAWTDSFLDIYASAMLRHLDTITLSGLWREYDRRAERSSFPHGRILLQPTVQQLVARGIRHEAEITWFERTADTPANRCLKYAVWLLGQRYIQLRPTTTESRRLWHRLNATYPMFDDVLLDHSRRFLNEPRVQGRQPLPTLRDYYRDALDLAIAIIEERSVLIDIAGEAVRLPSIVVNMNYVFEGYIRNTLALYARSLGWSADVRDGKKDASRPLFDGPGEHDATPDIVVERPDGTSSLILEVKNVPGTGDPKRDAINQAVTYALRYRTGQVVLVTPCTEGQVSGLRQLGDIDTVRVHHYRFDLGAPDLVAEEANFAAAVSPLVSEASRSSASLR